MSVRTEVDQSTGSKREPGLPQFSNRPYVVHASAGSWGVRLYGRSNRLQTEFEHFGRTVSQLHSSTVFQMRAVCIVFQIHLDVSVGPDTGYTSTACLKSLSGTSTFEQVDNVAKK